MLPKRSRLTKRIIEENLRDARRIKTAHFLVIFGKTPEASAPQVSFSASKKVGKTAVMRNKLRRRGYSAVTPLLPSLSKNSLILVMYSSAWTNGSITEITTELESAFKKAGIM